MNYSAARSSYAQVDLVSRVQSASPHQLVAILFDETLKALAAMEAAAARKDRVRTAACQSRGLTALFGLESSLNPQAGPLAETLASVYAECRRLTVESGRTCDPVGVARARSMIAEIAAAWDEIG